jgi:hypothetical protein
VAEHKILQKSYNDYLGVEEAGKELILYAVGDDALAPLKNYTLSSEGVALRDWVCPYTRR